MKKLISVLFAMMLMFSVTVFAEEADVTGEWYGSLMGISVTLTFNEDGTYAMIMAVSPDDAMEGTWELKDGEVIVDAGTASEGRFAYDGETLTMSDDEYELVLTREPVEEFAPAEPVKDAQLEDYEGRWVSGMVEAMGVTVDGKAAGLELKAKVEGTTVTLDSDSLGFSGQSLDFEFKDGALSFEMNLGGDETETEGTSLSTSIKLQLLEDGTMAIYMQAVGQDVVLYMTPVEEAEVETETETETEAA